jgi:hypothetical protein
MGETTNEISDAFHIVLIARKLDHEHAFFHNGTKLENDGHKGGENEAPHRVHQQRRCEYENDGASIHGVPDDTIGTRGDDYVNVSNQFGDH